MLLFYLFSYLFCSIYIHPIIIIHFFSIYLSSSNSSWSFSPHSRSLSLLLSSLIGFDLFFWYSFTSYLIISYGVYSLSINFVYFSTYYKHWGCSSFLSRVKILLSILFFISTGICILLSWVTFCLFLSLIEWSINFSASSWLRVENISQKYFLVEYSFHHNQGSNLLNYQYIPLLLNTSYLL